MAGRSEGRPRDVEPARAGQELVGKGLGFQERDKALELGGILGADVGSLTEEMLGVLDATNEGIDAGIAEAGVDDDGTDFLTGWLQEHQTAIGHVHHLLCRRNVGRVLLQVAELCQRKMWG